MATSVTSLCQQLQAAVASPDCPEVAARLAESLAASRSRVRVFANPVAASSCWQPFDDGSGGLLVSVLLQARDAEPSKPLRLVLPRAATVGDLKAELLLSFGLPPMRQCCITADRRLAMDHEKLDTCLNAADAGAGAGAAAGAGAGLPLVRIYVQTGPSWKWPPDDLEDLKATVLNERVRRQSQIAAAAAAAEHGDDVTNGAAAVAAAEPEVEQEPGWCCPQCTLRNPPGRPGCTACGHSRPEDYQVPREFLLEEEMKQEKLQAEFLLQTAQQRERNMQTMITLAQGSIIPVDTRQAFECPVCCLEIGGDNGDEEGVVVRGIRLRECGHEVCSDCLRGQALAAESLPVRCPCEPCQQTITDVELKRLLSAEELARLHRLGLRQAEGGITNAFHCVTTNCEGFVELVDEVNDFDCPVCNEHNCVPCRASHRDVTCRQYQDELKRLAHNDENARLGLAKLEEMLQSGEAMNCPKCKVFLQKRDGCDWLMCSVCRTEICWATRGPRWGPDGKGDTSGGCRCRVGGNRCHPQCMNCH